MIVRRTSYVVVTCALASSAWLHAQGTAPAWRAAEDEIMRPYQAVLRLDTTTPPGTAHHAVD